MLFSIADTIVARCLAFPTRVAVEVLDGSAPVSYGEIWQRISALTRLLANVGAGRHGPTVGMLLPNGVDAALVYAACQRAGVTGVTLNGRLTELEMTDIVEDSDCQTLVSAGPYLPKARNLSKSSSIRLIDLGSVPTPDLTERPKLGETEIGDKPCVVAYSSGTTGRPKGAIYSNDYFSMNNYRWGWEFGLTADQIILITGPMFHLSFAGFTLAGLSIGARIRIMPEFSADIAFDELSNNCSFAFMVPSMLTMVAETWESRGRPVALSARHIISAGAPLPLALTEQAMEIFPNARIAEMYGSTEASFVSYEVKHRDNLLAHSVGWPALGADVALFDEDGLRCEAGRAGEIGVRSCIGFSGYLGNPEQNAAAWHQGYLMTGDIGVWHTDGRLCVVDRKKDMVISGGENVFTAEVERVLLEHPDIKAAAVVGLPDDRWGERVAAMLVRHQATTVSADDLTQYCRKYLAAYKIPRQIEFAAELPCNAMGKVQKFRVKEIMTGSPSA